MRIPFLCPKPKYRVEAILGDSGMWYWRITSSINGQIMAHSESYSSHDACLDSALAVARNAGWPISSIVGRP